MASAWASAYRDTFAAMWKGCAKLFAGVSIASGAFLLALNLYGLMDDGMDSDRFEPIPFRDEGWRTIDADTIPYREALALLEPIPGETQRAYLERATAAVSRRIRHFWVWQEDHPYQGGFNFIGTARSNFVLHALGRLTVAPSNPFRPLILHDPELALERSFGTCTQGALVLHRVLTRNGIHSEILNFAPDDWNHVVVEVRLGDGSGFIADTDFGVLIPHSADEVGQNPEVLRRYYRGATDAEQRLGDVYATALAKPYERYGNVMGRSEFLLWRGVAETLAAAAKWILPLMLLTTPGLLRRRFTAGSGGTGPRGSAG
ncbi:MAG: hypothetical protein AAGD06_04165 [Acidobacteriota bacterium]